MSEPATPAPAAATPPTIRRDGTVLGFDVGSRRIGVAIGSSFGTHARAIAVVDVHGHGPDWTAVERLIKEWLPDGLVVGDPLTLTARTSPTASVRRALPASCGNVSNCRWCWSTSVPARSRRHAGSRSSAPKAANAVAMPLHSMQWPRR